MSSIQQIITSTGTVGTTNQTVAFNPFPGTNNVAITGSGTVPNNPVSFQVRSTISGTNVGTPANSSAALGEFSFKSQNNTVAITTGSGGLNVVDFATVPFRASNEWFVAKNGNDTTGTGAPSSPYLTIQAAITAAEAAVGSTWTATSATQIIYVAPGVYAENLTINKGFLRITTLALQTGDDGEGTAPAALIGAQNVVVQPAAGSPVTINMTQAVAGSGQAQRTVSFQGIVIDASLGTSAGLTCTSGSWNYQLSMAYCRVLARARAILITSTGLLQTYNDVVFLQTGVGGTSSLVEINRGQASFVDCNFSVAAGNDSHCLLMASTGTLGECSRCNFFSASNPALTASKPIIVIDGSASTATPISNCLFAYTTVPTVPRGATSSAIHIYGTAPVGLLLFNNLFWLLGTDAVTGRIMTAAGTPALCYGSNNVAPLGFAYKSNVTIQSLVPIATA